MSNEKQIEKEMPGILKRLLLFMDHQRLTAYQINKEAGLTKGLITNAISKKLGLTTGTLEALLNAYPQLNANWLLVGRGNMLMDEAEGEKEAAKKLTAEHLEDLQHLQDQCVEMVRQIQQMKQREQTRQENQLLEEILKK